jgi:multicomponent Na+:H+ antiporter subunit B
MTLAVRRGLFLVSGAGLFAFLLWTFGGLPDFGHYLGPYGDILNRVSVPERRTTAVVSAINFDYRALDTLGEEFILFAAVVAVASLLRHLRGERERRPDDDARGRRVRDSSAAVTLAGLGLIGPTLLVGLYIVIHGHQTPGGGFQGGVILATALLLVYLSDQYVTLRRVGPPALNELAEALGTASLVLLGVGGVVLASAYFENFLPLGHVGHLLSAGTIPVASTCVGLAVTGGFALMVTEFLEQTLVVRRDRREGRRRGRRRSR